MEIVFSAVGAAATLIAATIAFLHFRRQQRQDRLASLEKRIDLAQKRGETIRVEQLTQEYERLLEGQKSQEKLEAAAPKVVNLEGPSVPNTKLEELALLLTSALNAPDVSPEGHFLRGNVYYEIGDFDSAIVELSVALRINPRYASAYSSRGCAYGSKGDYYHAIADLNNAICLDPDDGDAYYNRGVVYTSTREHDLAIESYSEAINHNSYYTYRAFNNRGVAYAMKGEHDKAIENFDCAIRFDPNRPEGYTNRGASYGAKGDYDKALSDFNQALSLDDNYANAYHGIGNVHLELGEIQEAKKAFTTAKELGYDPALIDQALARLDS